MSFTRAVFFHLWFFISLAATEAVTFSALKSGQNVLNYLAVINSGADNVQQVIRCRNNACHLKEPDFVFLINKLINKNYHQQTVFKFIELKVTDKRYVEIRRISEGDGTTSTLIDKIPIGYGCTDKNSPKNFLAYRKLYSEYYLSKTANKIAALFLNLDKLFPCVADGSNDTMSHGGVTCKSLTDKEDGFIKGKALLEAIGGRKGFKIFGQNTSTYGFAIQDCPLMFGYNGCLSNGYRKVIMCVLPSESCFCA